MSQNASSASAQLARFLDRTGVPYELVEHAGAFSALDEAAAAGVEPTTVAKTLVLHDRDGYRLAIVPATHRLDVAAARTALRASRHLRLATEEEIGAAFPDFEVGALPPFGESLPLPEVVDVRLLYCPRVLCAAGDHRHGVLLHPGDLLRVTEPRVADICERSPGEHRFADVPRP